MPFIPHTEEDIREMLAACGVAAIDDLFDEIPAGFLGAELEGIPEGLGEMGVARLMAERAEQDGRPLCFAGAGAYDHHIPAAVWEIATRGEFYTAYTPYQPEASQGLLQVIYEFQTMMAELTAMEVANASLYDGASGLAEAVLMAVRLKGKKRVLIPRTVHPAYRKVVRTLVSPQGIEVSELPYDPEAGTTVLPEGGEASALVIPQPNFFGRLEEADALTDWAHERGLLAIGLVNPTAMALLKPPGAWGEQGADIACGEGQPLGVPLSGGGPYFGFLCCRKAFVRQMPGRLVGATVDRQGRRGYTLTLQAREQHIRRGRATSNICTNQGLLTTVAALYLALLGPEGLKRVAAACHAHTARLVEALGELGIRPIFAGPFFHEVPLALPIPAEDILRAMAAQNIVAGYPLERDYPELGNALLVCATEARTEEDIAAYAGHMRRILERRKAVICPIQPKW